MFEDVMNFYENRVEHSKQVLKTIELYNIFMLYFLL